MKIRKNVKLAKYITFRVGGPARYFVEVKSVDELREALDFGLKEKLKIFILGGGSNTLFSDSGFDGLVIKVDIKEVSFENESVQAGAGEIWDTLVMKAVKRGLSGIENLSLIPGTVGGAVFQNIGAYGAELKDVLELVEVFNTKTKKIEKLPLKDCNFGYRDSIFQHNQAYIILGATLRLSEKFSPNIKYPDLTEYFKNKKPTLKAVREAVIRIRKSKLVYPTKNIGTVGSFFKNPIITVAGYKSLINKYPDIKGREAGKGFIKLSAGQLIEKAGWKNRRLGNAGTSKRHALVLVSYKGARADDILKLSKIIQKSVKDKFDIRLEPEVRIIT